MPVHQGSYQRETLDGTQVTHFKLTSTRFCILYVKKRTLVKPSNGYIKSNTILKDSGWQFNSFVLFCFLIKTLGRKSSI